MLEFNIYYRIDDHMTKPIYYSVDEVHQFIYSVFLHLGVPEDESKICAEILITSDLRGIESHGIGRLRMYVERIKSGLINSKTDFEIVKESPTTAVVDGHHGIGMVVGFHSMALAIQKAGEYGLGAVAVRNSSHFGIDGYYPLMAVKKGMIGMSFTNARPAVPATFGCQPVLGTNPIAFGAPTDEEFPFLYDAATSITQRGKIEVLKREGSLVKNGWVIDDLGNTMVKPDLILKGLSSGKAALLPLGGLLEDFGSHKGFGLSTIVEILSSALQSGAFLSALSGIDNEGKSTRFHVGHFFLAIKIENFISLDQFKNNIGGLLRELRATNKLPGKDRIFTAGEKEYESEKRIRQNGIAVNSALMKDIQYIKELIGLNESDQFFL
jgi:L-2-hydroxycarboxylate dehydrogenase (NAD+)